jgi:hypothetical protein
MFVIGKRSYDGISGVYVTAIREGGRSLECVRVFDDRRSNELWRLRVWSREETAQRARDRLAELGGFDDYYVEAA